MQILKRISLFIIICSSLFMLTSCKKNYDKIAHLSYQEILSVNEKEYYVFIHMSSCQICKTIEEDIYNYAKSAKRNNVPKLYVVNRSEKENYDHLSQTKEPYNEDYSALVGSKNIEDIKLCTSPVMLKIKNQTIIGVYDEKLLILNELGIEGNNE